MRKHEEGGLSPRQEKRQDIQAQADRPACVSMRVTYKQLRARAHFDAARSKVPVKLLTLSIHRDLAMLLRYVNACLWSKAGHFNKSLSKAPKTTSFIWNLHADAHDFDASSSSSTLLTRKVFSSNLAHISLILI